MLIKCIVARTERQKFEERCKRLNLSKFMQSLFPDKTLTSWVIIPRKTVFCPEGSCRTELHLIVLSLCKSPLMIFFFGIKSMLTADPSTIMALFSYCSKQRSLYSYFWILLLSSKNYLDTLAWTSDYVHMKKSTAKTCDIPSKDFMDSMIWSIFWLKTVFLTLEGAD